MIISQQLSSDSDPLINPIMYCFMVGILQYLTITYPNITHDVNSTGQYMQSLIVSHFKALKHILRYVKCTFHYGLCFSPLLTSFIAYYDADWAGCPDTFRSTFGYAIFLGDNLILWSAKK